jgi:hypothetical protein
MADATAYYLRSAATGRANHQEDVMAKDRPGKEKKKPKADKNKKPKNAPFGGKAPPSSMGGGKK